MGKPDELTRLPEVTPPGMRRVEAECAEGAAAFMGRARSLPYVEDVTIFGNSLHLLVEAGIDDRQIARDLSRVRPRAGHRSPDRALRSRTSSCA